MSSAKKILLRVIILAGLIFVVSGTLQPTAAYASTCTDNCAFQKRDCVAQCSGNGSCRTLCLEAYGACLSDCL